MEKVLFADLFTKTLRKTLVKVPRVVIDDPIFRLHYKVTGLALLFASILVSGYQFFGNPIMCIQKDDIPEQLLNTYCWIESTFTLPKALFQEVGVEVVYPGVGKYTQGDEIVTHAYYQWVCFMLLLQAIMFCLPNVLWRALESGKMRSLIKKLYEPIPVLEEGQDLETWFKGIANYFRLGRSEHQQYAMKFFVCEVLNFVNVVGQIFLIDKFLGGEFRNYGTEVFKYANTEQEDRFDPMIRVFPRITKCTFHKYGSSGDVQRHDALCLLPLNILNEKIFIVMWFWFVILAILGGLLIVYRLIVMISNQARFLLLSCVASLSAKGDIRDVIANLSYGDFFMLYTLADNIDNLHFRQIILLIKESQYEMQSTMRATSPNKLIIDVPDKGYPSKAMSSKESDALIDNGESSV
ncbi:innexin inx2 [Parasteatoda tepidariorum]|uniref:innexin inx2 n=1 Tax=Parasteatoda tepidariorum TaxID=114398 RepID=UPI00077FB905|nr:innexin inx2 [Parasteatoda tepidariorum]